MTAAFNPRQHDSEMNRAIHDLLAERADLQAQVHELTVELEVARQMLRARAGGGV